MGLKSLNSFINESTTLLDKHTREPLFQQGEPYTLRQFIVYINLKKV